MSTRINGKEVADNINSKTKENIILLRKKCARAPLLAIIQVGNNPASTLYIKNKIKACKQVGIDAKLISLPENVAINKLKETIQNLNEASAVDGILLQLPLPQHIPQHELFNIIAINKDVDGFHAYNLGRLFQSVPNFRPCTPYGIMRLLLTLPVKLNGAHAVIVGASNIVGKPMIAELLTAGATVSICHNLTKNLKFMVESAEILIVAVGKAGLIPGEWIKPGTTVIDVGINQMPDGKIVGDVVFASAALRAKWITPVPGGVGPMTIAILLENTLTAYCHHNNLTY